MDLYKKIKNLTAERKISIRKLEEDLKYGNGTIRRWDNVTPGVDKIQKVADYFNVSVDYLIGRSDIKHTLNWAKFDEQLDLNKLQQEVSRIEKIDKNSPEYINSKELVDTIDHYETQLHKNDFILDLNKVNNQEVLILLNNNKLSNKERLSLQLFIEGIEKLRNL